MMTLTLPQVNRSEKMIWLFDWWRPAFQGCTRWNSKGAATWFERFRRGE